MDFDDILPDVGEYGKYQQLMVWLVLLPGMIPCGFHAYNQLFMATVPPRLKTHHAWHPLQISIGIIISTTTKKAKAATRIRADCEHNAHPFSFFSFSN